MNTRRALLRAVPCLLALLVGCSSGSGADAGSPLPDVVVTDVGPTDNGTPDVAMDTGTDLGTDTGTLDSGTMDAPTDTASPDVLADAPTDAGPAPCASDSDCASNPAGSVCDTASGRCVQCVASADTCPAAQHCDPSSDTCVSGCRSDDGCAATDGGTSALYCNTNTHTCVQCTTDAECPAGMLCAGATCAAGCSTDHPCPGAATCCGSACVDTSSNTANCGACGTACSVANAVAGCAAGACTVGSCMAPFADCDGLASNGCETYTLTSAAHCGACATACPAVPNGTASCAAGTCGYVCTLGYRDCDGVAANGCEAVLATDPANCGACGVTCASGVCAGGTCQAPSCTDHVRNGAETDVDCGGGDGCPTCDLCAHCGANTDCTAGTCDAAGQCTYSTTVYIDWLTTCHGPDGMAMDVNIASVPAGNYRITAVASGGTVWNPVSYPTDGWFWEITCPDLLVPALATPSGTYYPSAAAAFAALPATTSTVSFAGGTLDCYLPDSHCGDNQGGVGFTMERTCP